MAESATKQDLLSIQPDWQHVTSHFDAKLENFLLRLTVRFGVMLAAGVGAFAALVKLT
jgi:hypothetical protein